jgi:hypothetical protein
VLEGGGCACTAPGSSKAASNPLAWLAFSLLLWRVRNRRNTRRQRPSC